MSAARERLPNRRGTEVIDFTDEGRNYTASISRYSSGTIGEIFLDTDKPNSSVSIYANTSAILASLLLQHGVSAETIQHSISGPLATLLGLIAANSSAVTP